MILCVSDVKVGNSLYEYLSEIRRLFWLCWLLFLKDEKLVVDVSFVNLRFVVIFSVRRLLVILFGLGMCLVLLNGLVWKMFVFVLG